MFKFRKRPKPTLAELERTLEEMVKEGILEKNSEGKFRLLKNTKEGKDHDWINFCTGFICERVLYVA